MIDEEKTPGDASHESMMSYFRGVSKDYHKFVATTRALLFPAYIQRLTRELEAGDVYSRFSDYYVFEKVLGTGAFGRVVQVH